MTRLFLSVSLLLCLLPGCSLWSYDMGPSLKHIEVPQASDQLTVSDVLQQFGPPLRMSATSGGYVMAWEHWHIEEQKFGVSLGFAGADLMSIDWGNSQTNGEFLLLGFNHDHQLVDSVITSWDKDVGGGQGIQPFIGVVSVVDVDDLTRRLPQHRWGAGSLEDLPVTLNSQNRQDTGQNGIQQRGTSSGAGQESLELH